MQGQSRIEDAILFDSNEDSLRGMTLTEHVARLDNMGKFLLSAIERNRVNLGDLKDTVKNQISNLKTRVQVLQNSTKQESNRLKSIFQPMVVQEAKKVGQMKVEVGKLTTEQLNTKKHILNLEAMVNHCETEIGFKEMQSIHSK